MPGALGLVLALTLTACGWQSDDDAGGGGDAAADYPSQDINLVVGRSAGGGHDEYARVIAAELEKHLDATVVVSNVEGAGGRVAMQEVASAEPDGYTIHLFEPNGPAAYQVVADPSVDVTNFTFLGKVSERPSAFAVAADSEIQSWEQLVAAGKANTLKFATAGLTSPNFVNGAIAAEAAGIQFEPVPHEGSAEAMTSVVRGDSDYCVFSGDSVAEAVSAGDLRGLVQFASEPLGTLPDAPTGAEVGLEQFDGVLATGLLLVAPPGLPDDINSTLTTAVQDTLNSEALATWSQESQRIVTPGTPEEAEQMLQGALSTYGDYADLLGEYLDEG